MIIQFCGLSGSGKTTLATRINHLLKEQHIGSEIIDGDVYRKTLCADLGFSRENRSENIRRLAAKAAELDLDHDVVIISAINPYESIRQEITRRYPNVKTVYINCDMQTLIARDTKKLYYRALLPDGHPDKLNNLTGVNDPFEIPVNPDLVITTNEERVDSSAQKLFFFILSTLNKKANLLG